MMKWKIGSKLIKGLFTLRLKKYVRVEQFSELAPNIIIFFFLQKNHGSRMGSR